MSACCSFEGDLCSSCLTSFKKGEVLAVRGDDEGGLIGLNDTDPPCSGLWVGGERVAGGFDLTGDPPSSSSLSGCSDGIPGDTDVTVDVAVQVVPAGDNR